MKIFLGADHRGVDLRNVLFEYLKEEGDVMPWDEA